MWRVWCKALGQKEGRTNHEADRIALVRTLILATYLITNCFIVAGVIRHWNAVKDCQPGSNPGVLIGDL